MSLNLSMGNNKQEPQTKQQFQQKKASTEENCKRFLRYKFNVQFKTHSENEM